MIELITAHVCVECVAGIVLGIVLLCLGVLNDSEDVSDEDYSI